MSTFFCDEYVEFKQLTFAVVVVVSFFHKLSAGAPAKALTESIKRKRYLLGPIDGGRPPVIGRHQTPLLKRHASSPKTADWLAQLVGYQTSERKARVRLLAGPTLRVLK